MNPACPSPAAPQSLVLTPPPIPARQPPQGGEHGQADHRLQLGPRRWAACGRGAAPAPAACLRPCARAPRPACTIRAGPCCPPSARPRAAHVADVDPRTATTRPRSTLAGTSCSTWTGVRLSDVLRLCGIKSLEEGARHVCFRGPKGELGCGAWGGARRKAAGGCRGSSVVGRAAGRTVRRARSCSAPAGFRRSPGMPAPAAPELQASCPRATTAPTAPL